jgi:poly-beta-1,6-N-acetyl-D-glucosamine synthase
MLSKYILITPARDEAQFIELTLKSVVGQTVLPVKWVIVSDGSTDGTDEIVKRYAAEHPWIELVRMPERRERHFAGKAFAFNAGYARVRELDYEVIANLDGDLSFDEEYFSFLLTKFAKHPKLGVAGTPFREDSNQAYYNFDIVGLDHVSGACQMFRRECFEEIGGYIPMKLGGVDYVALTSARMKGWTTRTFTDKYCFHHRKMGSALTNGALKSKFKIGQKDYVFGAHPLWQIVRIGYQMTKKPLLFGGLALGSGYFIAAARGEERPIPPEMVAFRQREQMQRLKRFFTRQRGAAALASKVSVEAEAAAGRNVDEANGFSARTDSSATAPVRNSRADLAALAESGNSTVMVAERVAASDPAPASPPQTTTTGCKGLLIVNADDWGRDAETTDRTMECVRRGAVSAVSAMVFMQDSERAAAIAREQGIDAGLHLNLTSPFTADGCSPKLMKQQQRLARFLRGQKFASVVFHPGLANAFQYVVAAQIEEFQRIFGAAPARIDGHHHMHLAANVLFAKLLPEGTLIRRNFTFQAGEKSAANRAYRKFVDNRLARRHRMVDFFYSLPPMNVPGRLEKIFLLACDHFVELETHPVNPAEYAFLEGGEIFQRIGNAHIGPFSDFQNLAERSTVPSGR